MELPSRTVEITPRMMLAFAAGIGEFSAFTSDDSARLFVAPKSFCAVLEWPVIVQTRQSAALGLRDEERLRGVHVEQDSVFHGLIRAGDRLRTNGRIAAIRKSSAGALIRFELTTVDTNDGTPVVTTQYSTIFRGVDVAGTGGEIETADALPWSADSLTQEAVIPIAREAGHVYTECSGIWNPIHTERRAALQAGLPDIIVHGTALWAIAGRELVRHYAGGNPACLLRLRARFRSPVIPGCNVRLCHGGAGGDIRFEIRLENGTVAVSDGAAVLMPARES